jgi:hypothetical protein
MKNIGGLILGIGFIIMTYAIFVGIAIMEGMI